MPASPKPGGDSTELGRGSFEPGALPECRMLAAGATPTKEERRARAMAIQA